MFGMMIDTCPKFYRVSKEPVSQIWMLSSTPVYDIMVKVKDLEFLC